MNVLVITPAATGSRAGNRATAIRYRRLLTATGLCCRIEQALEFAQADEWPVDCVIVLHAIRGRYAITDAKFRRIPLIVVLTGTDYYHFQFTQPIEFEASLDAADVLICLHDRGYLAVPERFHEKLMVVKQSVAFEEEAAELAPGIDPTLTHLVPPTFPVALIGHLRKEKDPFLAARAAALLPSASRLQVLHAGSAPSEDWATQARELMASNARYHWFGELTRPATKTLLDQSALMVITSIMEGGANIVSEACTFGRAILASNIDGNTGLLGSDYPGLFESGDARALMEQLHRCETDPAYLASLAMWCKGLADDFTPARETLGLLQAIARARSDTK